MAIRTIIKQNDTTLRKKSKTVDKFDDRLAQLLDDMADTMHRAEGLGLAAVQVGVLKRVFIVETEGALYEIINPTILSCEGELIDNEGCLSVEGFRGIVARPEKVSMSYFNRFGQKQIVSLQGYPARALMHEYDHLEGILFSDKMIKKVPN